MVIGRFFIDPVLRGPTIGSMILCMIAGVVGVLVFLRKRSLVGETLSHATYPGVTATLICAGFFSIEKALPFLVLIGAFFSALIGFWLLNLMEKKVKTAPDAALTAVLALFFGVGVTIASIAQNGYTHLFRQMNSFLYGQAATMTDIHIVLYAIIACLILLFIILFYKELLTITFDAGFAQSSGMPLRFLEVANFCLIVLTLVIGIRCAGVILMSAMLIAPAAAARQFTNRLGQMLVWAAFFGALSGFLGIYSSLLLSQRFEGHYAVPTGPMIVLISGGIAFYALLFAPKRGLVIRYIRIVRFRGVCIEENILKALWRLSQGGNHSVTAEDVARKLGFLTPYILWRFGRLKRQKALQKQGKNYYLSKLGTLRGARIVRLHRLWEAYLFYSLGLKVERVHKSAEEMEHILTPELEKKLTLLLEDPQQDPHHQPIPPQEKGGAFRPLQRRA